MYSNFNLILKSQPRFGLNRFGFGRHRQSSGGVDSGRGSLASVSTVCRIFKAKYPLQLSLITKSWRLSIPSKLFKYLFSFYP